MALFKHRLHDLPARIQIEIPEASSGPGILTVIGIIIGVIGGGFIIFGPETIYYNRYEGMNLLQMLQAYPGPIASVGFLLVTLGGLWSSNEEKERLKKIEECLYSQLAFSPEDIPDGKMLDFERNEDGSFTVSLVDFTPEMLEEADTVTRRTIEDDTDGFVADRPKDAEPAFVKVEADSQKTSATERV
ncbi:hypothetical protein [Oceanospirillum sanctuarii]|uniref:hypothetical protein n=1 Tax=Oceanospirillum sanctuarii TaxID=1434821 RepID=UPI000A378512|nr:hypothetical protein [Oceanospirillum sanctuarii]